MCCHLAASALLAATCDSSSSDMSTRCSHLVDRRRCQHRMSVARTSDGACKGPAQAMVCNSSCCLVLVLHQWSVCSRRHELSCNQHSREEKRILKWSYIRTTPTLTSPAYTKWASLLHAWCSLATHECQRHSLGITADLVCLALTNRMHPRVDDKCSNQTVKGCCQAHTACLALPHSQPHPHMLHSKASQMEQSTPTFFVARYRRTYFCNVIAAAWMRAWRAARAAAFLPAAVVRLKRVRTSHMRTQLCTTVALRFLQQASTQSCMCSHTRNHTFLVEGLAGHDALVPAHVSGPPAVSSSYVCVLQLA